MLMTLSIFGQLALGLFDSEADLARTLGRVTFWVFLIGLVIYLIIRKTRKGEK